MYVNECKANRLENRCIIYSQALRYNRICSDTSERDQHLETLRKDFIDRGYNPRVIDHNIHRATKVSRSQLLKYKQKRDTDRVPLVTTYNPQLKALRKIARELQGTLEKDNRQHTIFPDPPLLAFRQPPNLRKLLIRSSLSGPTNNGTHPCGRKRCKTCPHILSTDRVQIPGTIEEYYMHGHYTCSSSNVVYAITCTKCPTRGIYIGETGQSLRKRTNHHSPNHSLGDFQISVIKGNFKTENERKVWEYKLMQIFRSLETGLNLGHGFMANYQD
ncbi:hypothetical protein XELAEV_18047084mg [Xenopus laevis]|uniref:Helix-turn-helix domain-containing protein n=1 Tax=Xenopus laevis TaxID=8355 RepID=A0A974BUS0_XENLA|nr:hypothetical protein XELAEV_18047084mg [Xenopus laevis]